jgi:hypothetical protein
LIIDKVFAGLRPEAPNYTEMRWGVEDPDGLMPQPPEYLDPQDNEPGTPEDDAVCGTCQLLSRREPSELRLDQF